MLTLAVCVPSTLNSTPAEPLVVPPKFVVALDSVSAAVPPPVPPLLKEIVSLVPVVVEFGSVPLGL